MLRGLANGMILSGVLLAAQAAGALSVTLDPGGWTTSLTDTAVEGIGSPVQSTVSPASFPETASTPGVVQGASSAVLDYALSNAGFDVGFTQTVAAPTGSGSQGTAYIYFSVDQDAGYQITGIFDVSDSEGRGVYFRTLLADITGAPTTLFQSNQYSDHTVDESFTVGLQEGDTSNVLLGSATGTLLAGHVYRFYADAALESYPDPARATTASGTGTIALALIPEPASLLLVGAALLGLGARRRIGRRSVAWRPA